MFMTNFSYVSFSVFLVQAFVWPSLGIVNSQRRWRNKSRRGMQRGLSIRLFIRGGRIYRRRPKRRRTRNGTRTKRCPKTRKSKRSRRRRSQTRCCCSKSNRENPVLRIPRPKRSIRRKRNFKNRKKTLKRERQRTKSRRKRRWMKSEIYQSQRWSQP